MGSGGPQDRKAEQISFYVIPMLPSGPLWVTGAFMAVAILVIQRLETLAWEACVLLLSALPAP